MDELNETGELKLNSPSKNKRWDIFISYRREGGYETAQLISDRLTARGYRVFFDIETMRAGNFSKQIYSVLDNCQDVLLIYSPDIFSRAVEQQRVHLEGHQEGDCPPDENDWVRMEIAYALKNKKNVIPLFLRNAIIPSSSELPADIASIPMLQGITATHEHFDSVLKKLCSRYLHSKPVWIRMTRMITIGGIFLLALVAALFYYANQEPPEFPVTDKEEKIMQEVCGNMLFYNLYSAQIIECKQTFYERCEDLVLETDVENRYANVKSAFEQAQETIQRIVIQMPIPPDSLRDALVGTPFDSGDFMALPQLLEAEKTNTLEGMNQVQHFFEPDKLLSNSELSTILRWNLAIVHEHSILVRNGTMDFFAPVRQEAIEDTIERFKKMTAIPYTEVPWSRDRTHLKSEMEGSLNRIREHVEKISEVIGNIKGDIRNIEDLLTRQLILEGYSEEEARKMVKEVDAMDEMDEEMTFPADNVDEQRRSIEQKKEELEKMGDNFEHIRQQAAAKFAPKPDDSSGILWGKVQRLLTFAQYDIALESVNLFEQKAGPEWMDVTAYLPAVRALIEQAKTGAILPYGGVVFGFEPPATSHPIFQVGDILRQVNGQECYTSEEYNQALHQDKTLSNEILLLRLNEKGQLQERKVELIPSDIRMGTLDLLERLPSVDEP